jgi:hypothetical protein
VFEFSTPLEDAVWVPFETVSEDQTQVAARMEAERILLKYIFELSSNTMPRSTEETCIGSSRTHGSNKVERLSSTVVRRRGQSLPLTTSKLRGFSEFRQMQARATDARAMFLLVP